jgi:hypothetical protein
MSGLKGQGDTVICGQSYFVNKMLRASKKSLNK